MFDTSINLTLQSNDMTCNNNFEPLNTVKSRSFFFKERSEGKGFKNNSLCGILSFDSFTVNSEARCYTISYATPICILGCKRLKSS